MTLAELLASKKQGTGRFPGLGLVDLLARRNEPLDAKFNPSGVGPGVSYGSLASILADFAPGIGDVKSATDAIKEAEAGNYGMSLADALGALPLIGGMGAIKAYHGSPHTFDAFDMSKIGTGEGAQAYGHGLYFAENPETAESYMSVGGRISDRFFSGGKELKGLARNIADDIVNHGLAVAERNAAANGPDFLDVFEKLKNDGVTGNKANLYETSLEWPDPAREAADPLGPQHFLDWDKPLSEQMEIMRALENAGILGGRKILGPPGEQWEAAIGPDGTYVNINDKAQRAYIAAQQALTADVASRKFKEAGIPGIRYLDQGSRGAGNGTYNYVVFDDKIPRIVSRNGVTLADLLKR